MLSNHKRAVLICAVMLVACSAAFAAYGAQPGVNYERVKIYTGVVGSDQWNWGWAAVGDNPSDAWAHWGSLTTGVMDLQAAADDRYIYEMGGLPATLTYTRVDLNWSDGVNRTWHALAPIPVPVSNGTAARIGDTIYLCTGYSGGTLINKTYKYSISGNDWSVITGANAHNWEPTCCALDGKLWLIGGCDAAGATNPSTDLWCYTPGDATPWVKKASCHTGRVFAQMVAHDGKLWVAGGTQADGNGFMDCEWYDPSTDVWSAVNSPEFPNMPENCWGAAHGAPGNTFFIFGGAANGYVKTDGMEFDFATHTWTIITIPADHHVYRGEGVADNFAVGYSLGGSTGGFTPQTTVSYNQYAVAHDVGCSQIISPSGDCDSGFTITPVAKIKNYGLNPEGGFQVTFRIDDIYTDHATVTSLLPLIGETTIAFTPIIMTKRGPHVASCSTEMAGDMLLGNDKKSTIFTVQVRDVECIHIAEPAGTVDSNDYVIPVGIVYNNGTAPGGFYTMMKIWNPQHPEWPGYYDQESVYVLPGGNTNVTFAAWTAHPRGTLTVRCSTMYDYELHHENDAKTSQIICRVRDAVARAIVWPVGDNVGSGMNTPQAQIFNAGTSTEDIPARFRIYDMTQQVIYEETDTQPVQPSKSLTYTFGAVYMNPGTYTSEVTTLLDGDVNNINDMVVDTFTVTPLQRDVGVSAVQRPHSPTEDTVPFTPAATAKNYGQATESFKVWCLVRNGISGAIVYFDSAPVGPLTPGTSQPVPFTEWGGHKIQGIQYIVRAYTAMLGDPHPEDDTAFAAFQFQPVGNNFKWVVKAPMPFGNKGKSVKDGGCLTYSESSDSGFVWGFKGNNTLEFYQYGTANNTWMTKESLPLVSQATMKAKRVKKGAALGTGPDGMIYACKGNSSNEFWQFNPTPGPFAASQWTEKPPIPFGAKPLKEGTGMVGVTIGTDNYIYLLRGAGTYDFYRYNIGTSLWETMNPAPSGISGKPYKIGSALAYNPTTKLIYALKGNYNEFYAYNPDSNLWYTRAMLPYFGTSGHKKVCKDGSGLACLNGTTYGLKGNNTREFWYYVESLPGDHWTELADMPSSKGVKAGGHICSAGIPQGGIFGLTGNNTTEFYGYLPAVGFFSAPKQHDDIAGNGTTSIAQLTVTPNPFSGRTSIAYSLPKAGNVSIKLYDATGSLVATLNQGYSNAGSYTTHIDASSLARGIYLLKLNSASYNTTRKLILE